MSFHSRITASAAWAFEVSTTAVEVRECEDAAFCGDENAELLVNVVRKQVGQDVGLDIHAVPWQQFPKPLVQRLVGGPEQGRRELCCRHCHGVRLLPNALNSALCG
jgi:hypothetical protein